MGNVALRPPLKANGKRKLTSMAKASHSDTYREIKRHIDMKAACKALGIDIGRDGKIRCPLHPGERTPSCQVYVDHWKSFDCPQGHGDIFVLWQIVRGCGKREAFEELAQLAGVRLPEYTPEERERFQRQTDIQTILELIAANLATRLEEQKTEGAKIAAQWLLSRGISMKTAIDAGLGVAEGWSSALDLVRGHGGEAAVTLATKAGILARKESGKGARDHLHHCVIVPVHRHGRVQSLIGRTRTLLGEDDKRAGKTIKLAAASEETPYALPSPALWWPRGGRDARSPVYIAEGEIDAITLEQAGFQAVALLGTNAARNDDAVDDIVGGDFGEGRIYMIPDRDGAGRGAAKDLAERIGIRLYVIDLDTWAARKWKDPNDALKGYMADAPSDDLAERIEWATARVREDVAAGTEAAEPWHIWETKQICDSEGVGRSDIAQLVSERVAPVLGAIERQTVRSEAVARVAEMSGLRRADVARDATDAARSASRAKLTVIDGGKDDSGDEDDGRHPLVLPHDLDEAATVVLRWMALEPHDEHAIYQRGRELVRILPAYDRDGGEGVQVEALTPVMLRQYVHERARVMVLRSDGEATRDNMPLPLCEHILAMKQWPLAALVQIYRCPIIDPKGDIVTRSSYHEGLQSWVDIGDLEVPEVPAEPTAEDVSRAKSLIGELLYDFPFHGQSDMVNAIGLGMLPFVRPMVQAVTAPHFITAPTEGTGKSLLVQCMAEIATGRGPLTITQCKDDTEWRNQLGSSLMQSPSCVLIDNISQRQKLDSGVLASWWTSRTSYLRRFHTQTMVPIRNDAVWTLTGNNPATTSELARRFIWIRLVPEEERPSDRGGFRHPLPSWARENRAALCWAFLVLARSWIASGAPRPHSKIRVGSFDEHVRVIGGILGCAGISGFCDNRDEHYRAATPDQAEWTAFFERWWMDAPRGCAVSSRRAVEFAGIDGLLESALGDGNERSQRSRMGWQLAKRLDRVIRLWPGEAREVVVRLERSVNGHSKTQDYRLVEIHGGTSAQSPAASLLSEPGGARSPAKSRTEDKSPAEQNDGQQRPCGTLRDFAGLCSELPIADHTHTHACTKEGGSPIDDQSSLYRTLEKSRKVPQSPAEPYAADVVDAGLLEEVPEKSPASGVEVPQFAPGYTQDPDEDARDIEEEWS